MKTVVLDSERILDLALYVTCKKNMLVMKILKLGKQITKYGQMCILYIIIYFIEYFVCNIFVCGF